MCVKSSLTNPQTLLYLPVKLFQTKLEYFHSFGSDLFRLAVARYIACFSDMNVTLTAEQRRIWTMIIDSTLERKEAPVQIEASLAFRSYVRAFSHTSEEYQTYLDRLDSLKDPIARRGYALALGYFPATTCDYEGLLERVMQSLCGAAALQVDKAANDAEARRNAIYGLTELLTASEPVFLQKVRPALFRTVFIALLNGMCDYSTDSRGDVGSWVREACMMGMRNVCNVVLRVCESNQELAETYLAQDLVTNMVAKVLQQSVEKIDKIRACAGDVLLWAIDQNLPHLNGVEQLRTAFVRYDTVMNRPD